jgi:excisionase family DNA binding protein
MINNKSLITMNSNKELSNGDDSCVEKLSAKLDMVMARLDDVVSMLFYAKPTMTVEEAALYLGITRCTFYKIARKYHIKCSRPTKGKKYYRKEDLDAWLQSDTGKDGLNEEDYDDENDADDEMSNPFKL